MEPKASFVWLALGMFFISISVWMGAIRTAMINVRVLKIWLGFGEKVAREGEGGDGGSALSSTH
jgi:hypothetical protein